MNKNRVCYTLWIPAKRKWESRPVKLNSSERMSHEKNKEELVGISIDCAEILKIWKLVDDLLKRPNTKGVLGIHQLTNKIH